MRRHCRSSLVPWLLGIAFLSASMPSLAQPPVARWQADWGDLYCSLARTAGGAAAPNFVIRIIPGTDRPTILFVVPSGDRAPLREGSTTVTLTPSGTRFEADARFGMLGETRVVTLHDFDLGLLRDLSSAGGFEIAQNGETRRQETFTGAGGAIDVLQQCIDGALAEWGIDAARLASLRQWPESERGWVTATDYPADALRRGISGTSLARIAIDTAGRVTECTVVVSSGNAALDRASCSNATEWGRYRPALGPDGAPIAISFTTEIRWTSS